MKFALNKRDVYNLIFQLEQVSKNLTDSSSVAVLNIEELREDCLQSLKVEIFNHRAEASN